MHQEFQSPGFQRPLLIALIVHACAVLSGLLPGWRERPGATPEAEPYQALEVRALSPEQAALLLSLGASQAAPNLADLPRSSLARPQSGALDLELPDLPPRPGALVTPQPRLASPSGRLLERDLDLARERSKIATLRATALLESGDLRRRLEFDRDSLELPAPRPLEPRVIELEGRLLNALTLYREDPRLTPELLATGGAGLVWVELAIDPEGLVQDVSVVESSGQPALDAAALAAARRWRFDPVAVQREGTRRFRYRFRIDASAPGKTGGGE